MHAAMWGARMPNPYDVENAQQPVDHPECGLDEDGAHPEAGQAATVANGGHKGQPQHAVDATVWEERHEERHGSKRALRDVVAEQQGLVPSGEATVAEVEHAKGCGRKEQNVQHGLDDPLHRDASHRRQQDRVEEVDHDGCCGQQVHAIQEAHCWAKLPLQLGDVEVDQPQQRRVVKVVPANLDRRALGSGDLQWWQGAPDDLRLVPELVAAYYPSLRISDSAGRPMDRRGGGCGHAGHKPRVRTRNIAG
mmetsp:Transcript_70651/g.204731  ORF Transcript_70651/g.204731 Transcript_70651/m.204731 type:complete len:250 (+) Transcript_70651:231-980(+)